MPPPPEIFSLVEPGFNSGVNACSYAGRAHESILSSRDPTWESEPRSSASAQPEEWEVPRYSAFLKISRWWFQICFIFTLIYVRKRSNMTDIFQMGWNHQLDFYWFTQKKNATLPLLVFFVVEFEDLSYDGPLMVYQKIKASLPGNSAGDLFRMLDFKMWRKMVTLNPPGWFIESRWWLKNIFYVHPYLGKISHFDSYVSIGWFKHQLISICPNWCFLPVGISYHIVSYHFISFSYHIISYHIISYHILSYHINQII